MAERKTTAVKPKDQIIAIAVQTENSSWWAGLGGGFPDAVGRAADFVFPGRAARVREMRTDAEVDEVFRVGVAKGIAAKVAKGEQPTESELAMLGGRFREREARRFVNVTEVTAKAHAVRTEVNAQLPPHTEEEVARGTSETFKQRAESIAEELSDDDLRERFARILTGEVARPGRFSVQTLEAFRKMDRATAEAFETIRPFLLMNSALPLEGPGRFFHERVSYEIRSLLEDGDLLVGPVFLNIEQGADPSEMRIGSDTTARWEWTPGGQAHAQSQRLTRAGMELHAVLRPATAETGYVAAVCRWLRRSGMQKIEHRCDGDEGWTPVHDEPK